MLVSDEEKNAETSSSITKAPNSAPKGMVSKRMRKSLDAASVAARAHERHRLRKHPGVGIRKLSASAVSRDWLDRMKPMDFFAR
jgi:hypothetical protein